MRHLRERLRPLFQLPVIAILSLCGIALLLAPYGHERAYYDLLDTWHGPEGGLELDHYTFVVEARSVPGIGENLSSLSYDATRNHLWATTNKQPAALLALSTEGELLAHYPLPDYGDLESVEYLGDGLLALVDEYFQRLYIIRIDDLRPGGPSPEPLHSLLLGDGSGSNSGLEGIAYAGLDGVMPQPEGVAVDRDGLLYLASEPNLFYRLQRRSSPPSPP